MNKTDLVTAIMAKTDAYKKTHLVDKLKEELEAIYSDLTTDLKITENEKLLLATIPQLPDFTNVESVMNGREFLKKAEEINGVPLAKGCRLFKTLRDKGFYNAKAKESGQNRTTFQLSDMGIQYLIDNGLLAVS